MKNYISTPKTDLTFGIHPSAIAVAHLLGDFYYDIKGEHPNVFDEKFMDDFQSSVVFKTFPFYNGRENAICITFSTYMQSNKTLHVVFGENRNSDSIFVDTWVGSAPFNSPTVADFTDEAYEKRKFFPLKDIMKAVDYINTLMEDHVIMLLFEGQKEQNKKAKAK